MCVRFTVRLIGNIRTIRCLLEYVFVSSDCVVVRSGRRKLAAWLYIAY